MTEPHLKRIAEGIARVETELRGLLNDPELMHALASVPGPGTRACDELRHIVNSPAMLAGLSTEVARLLDGPQEGVGHGDGGL